MNTWNSPEAVFYSCFVELLIPRCVRTDQNCYLSTRCDIPTWKYHIWMLFHFEKEKRGKTPHFMNICIIYIYGFIGIMDNLPFACTFNNTVLNNYRKFGISNFSSGRTLVDGWLNAYRKLTTTQKGSKIVSLRTQEQVKMSQPLAL